MQEHYFMGAKVKGGFYNAFYDEIRDKGYYGYILKGGAGTGKSSLMKRVAAAFDTEQDVTVYHCSSDPDSLDAVVLHGSRVYICDGTAPHVMECAYPGVCEEIVNLGQFWDRETLEAQKTQIISSTDENKALLSGASDLQAALSDSCMSVKSMAESFIDEHKLSAFSGRLLKKLSLKPLPEKGHKTIRQLTALTEYGCMTLLDSLEGYDKIYTMSDSLFHAAHILTELIAAQAAALGYDVILSPSVAFNNKAFEHILIPEAGIAFLSDTPLTALSDIGEKINMRRFYDMKKAAGCKVVIRLDKSRIRVLSGLVYKTIAEAKKVHDRIEECYISAMDFERIENLTDGLIGQIAVR